jgi:BetI-type transcriptional repressor, C-terminal
MQRATDFVTTRTGPGGALRMALQIWSEATHDPALADFVKTVYGRIREILIRLARRAAEHGDLPEGADPYETGVVLLALMPGYALQRILTGEPTPDAFKAGLRTLLPGQTTR